MNLARLVYNPCGLTTSRPIPTYTDIHIIWRNASDERGCQTVERRPYSPVPSKSGQLCSSLSAETEGWSHIDYEHPSSVVAIGCRAGIAKMSSTRW
jgi:hypothetical protein